MAQLHRLLLVEDSEDDVLLFRRALQRYPELQIVARAADGDEAIAYLVGAGPYADREKYPLPDVMVLDLKMPRRNGLEVLAWMREMTQRPRVAVFTTSALDRDKEQALQLGADLYQQKTCEPDTFDRFAHWVSCMCAMDRKARARL